jgi:predicted transcriptional regulator
MDTKEWAIIQEQLLKSQLKIIRQFLREGEPPTLRLRKKSRSQVSIIFDVLSTAQVPLHISEIISRAKEMFDVDLDRDSIVSALTKKVKRGQIFKRIAPNTFALLDSSAGDT